MPKNNPFEVLGIPEDSSPEQVKAAYLEKSKTTHPDAGGTAEAFQELREAFMQASVEASKPKKCLECDGKGRKMITKGFHKMPMTCKACGGRGVKL